MMDLFEERLQSVCPEILGTYQVKWMGEKVDLDARLAAADDDRSRQAVPGRRFYAPSPTDAEAEAAGQVRRRRAGAGVGPHLGQLPLRVLRSEGRRHAGAADVHHDVPGGCLSPGQAQPGGPAADGALRALHLPQEMGNAFSELNDPIDQRERFMKQVELRGPGRRRGRYDGR